MNESIVDIKKNQKKIFDNQLIKKIIDEINNQDTNGLKISTKDLHPADLAELLEFLNSDQRIYLLNELDPSNYTDVLAELDDSIIDEMQRPM